MVLLKEVKIGELVELLDAISSLHQLVLQRL
jgi:hypothetical protein